MQSQLTLISAMILSGSMLLGCASEPRQQAAAAPDAATRDDRCVVTGSNVPNRDCRGDVRVLPPAAVETLQPTMPRLPSN